MWAVNCNSVGPFSPGTDELKLEVARTCNILGASPGLALEQSTTEGSEASNCNEAPILVGYLWKKSQSASRADESSNVWYRRWFVLKRDNCLYYYKNQDVSALLLASTTTLSLSLGGIFDYPLTSNCLSTLMVHW